jgi:Icc-related predicted phosphoesterase
LLESGERKEVRMLRKRFAPEKMKLLFSSDLHGLDSAYLKFVVALKEGDYNIGALGGDLMTFPSKSEIEQATIELHINVKSYSHQRRHWLSIIELALQKKQRYYKSVLEESSKPIVFVMGNDDGILGLGCEWTSENYIQNVNQRKIDSGKYNFVGYQYTNPFVGGTFEKSERNQEEDFEELEKLIDKDTILITHGPSWGILDTVDGEHMGSKALRELVERKPPRLHLFGHIHSNFGVKKNAINGSYFHSQKFVSIDVDVSFQRKVDRLKL